MPKFLTESLSGIPLDDTYSSTETRIDYSCLRGLLAVELKTLEDSSHERLKNLTDELSKQDDWPIFLGSAPMQSFINNMNDPEGVSRRVIERIGRAIINHLKKANRQLEAHTKAFPRQNVVRLLVLVNEDHEIYDPKAVSQILCHALERENGDRPLYEHIDGVLFLTERHATISNGKLTFPIVTVEGPDCFDAPWKGELLDLVSNRWGAINGYTTEQFQSVDDFVSIDHIPEQAPRYERWRTEYRRNPTLRQLTKEQLRDAFDENNILSLLCFLKDPPIKLSKDQQMGTIRRFGDFMQELGERGIPITDFQHSHERDFAAASRLGLPSQVTDWLIILHRESIQ